MLKYKIIIYWSEEDDSFIAEVPELPGCMADGDSYEEVLNNVKVVMEEWIETDRKLGRSIPTPKGSLRYAEQNGAVVVIKDVPAQICDNCGHSTELTKSKETLPVSDSQEPEILVEVSNAAGNSLIAHLFQQSPKYWLSFPHRYIFTAGSVSLLK